MDIPAFLCPSGSVIETVFAPVAGPASAGKQADAGDDKKKAEDDKKAEEQAAAGLGSLFG